MKPRSAKIIPVIIAAAVISLVCLLQVIPQHFPRFNLFERLEWITYDWRMRYAAEVTQPVTPDLGAVFIDDDSLKYINDTYGFSFPWPRQLYGRVVAELAQQGAKAVAVDILFIERQASAAAVTSADGKLMESDDFFARKLGEAGNVILAAAGIREGTNWSALVPPDMFRTNAFALGHISSEADADGVLRRGLPFHDDERYGRIWHMGIVLAAEALGLDLREAVVEKDRILLRGKKVERSIPLNADGTFNVNWNLAWNDQRLALESFEAVLEGQSAVDWRNKLVVLGSIGSGNNISDVGATPVSKTSYLVSKHWNIANSIITGQFITRSPLAVNMALIILLGAFAAMVTRHEKALVGSLLVLATVLAYLWASRLIFGYCNYSIPVVLPVCGALLTTHLCLVTHNVIFEQREKRHIRRVFSRIVSPNVVKELLDAEKLSLGGARREITVFFSDVRGFTEVTDAMQAKAEEVIARNGWSGQTADVYRDEIAGDTLQTINTYLANVADVVKKYDGTLDKYMGDCVMAFWGAPAATEQHALRAVEAAIETQRALHAMNQQRAIENEHRRKANARREAAGQSPLDLLPILALGTGINTGHAIVGLMGSEDHIVNYTVFGREVNLASRLEGISGRSRIIISEATYLHILRDDPKLAAACVELEPVTVKGIGRPVKVFEVPWAESVDAAVEGEPAGNIMAAALKTPAAG